MTEFRPQHSVLPERPAGPAAAKPIADDQQPAWVDCLASLIHDEIDAGMIVRVRLPGSASPVLIEDAAAYGDALALLDPQGGRYFVADPKGVVVIAQPLEPGMTAERALRGQCDYTARKVDRR